VIIDVSIKRELRSDVPVRLQVPRSGLGSFWTAFLQFLFVHTFKLRMERLIFCRVNLAIIGLYTDLFMAYILIHLIAR